MFMRYRGGGIGHEYMREIESRFEDMQHDQADPGTTPQATCPPHSTNGNIGTPPASTSSAIASTGNALRVDTNDDNHTEEEYTEDEWASVDPEEDDYLRVDDASDDDDNNGEEISQGTYGLGEY